jgi:hypothetical protein
MEKPICSMCKEKEATLMILWEGVIPKFICEDCDNLLEKEE